MISCSLPVMWLTLLPRDISGVVKQGLDRPVVDPKICPSLIAARAFLYSSELRIRGEYPVYPVRKERGTEFLRFYAGIECRRTFASGC